MVHELHKAGYQRLRIAAGMAPSGTHWRCAITSADNVGRDGWSRLDDAHCAKYTTGQGDQYFGWPDGPGKHARALAKLFSERFPEILRRAAGQDREYAGWYVDMLGAAENGLLPIFFADYPLQPDPAQMPPPVDASEQPAADSDDGERDDVEDLQTRLHAARTVVRAGLHLIEHGFGRMMLLPYDYKGMAWRCSFHPISFPSREFFRYSSSQGRQYLACHSGGSLPLDIDPQRLAQAIMVGVGDDHRQQCLGKVDSAYQRWLEAFKQHLDQGLLPEAFHEYSDDPGHWRFIDYGNLRAGARAVLIDAPPGYVQPGYEPSPWSADFERKSQDVWKQLRSERIATVDLAQVDDPEVVHGVATEYLQALGVPVTWQSNAHFQEAVRYALVEIIQRSGASKDVPLTAPDSEYLGDDPLQWVVPPVNQDPRVWLNEPRVVQIMVTDFCRQVITMSQSEPQAFLAWLDEEATRLDAMFLGYGDSLADHCKFRRTAWNTKDGLGAFIRNAAEWPVDGATSPGKQLFIRYAEDLLTTLRTNQAKPIAEWGWQLTACAEMLWGNLMGIVWDSAVEDGHADADSPTPPPAPLDPETPPPPLNAHDLTTHEGRMAFLGSLYEDYQEAGLLPAVSHVWQSLARPKALRCEQMAQALGLGGKGKTALTRFIRRFLQETLYEFEVPDLPDIKHYPDFDTWNAACMRYFDDLDSRLMAVLRRYEAILTGKVPGPVDNAPASVVIKGPWRRAKSER